MNHCTLYDKYTHEMDYILELIQTLSWNIFPEISWNHNIFQNINETIKYIMFY